MAKLSCDICGSSLIFAGDLDTLICETCGVKYSKEAIKQKFTSVNSITATNFPIETAVQQPVDTEKDNMIKRAEGFVTAKQYDRAVSAYWELIDKYPDDVEIIKRYIDLSVNFYADNINNITTALNSLKNLSDINTVPYIDTFYNNIMNNTVDIYSMFVKFNLSSSAFLETKELLKKNLSLLFTQEKINIIISTGIANSRYAKYLVKIDGSPIIKTRISCNYLIANYALCTKSDPDWCDLSRTEKVKSYNLSDIAELDKKSNLAKNRHKKGVCIYCGGKYKGMFSNKTCTNCGRLIVPQYVIYSDDKIIKILPEVKL